MKRVYKGVSVLLVFLLILSFAGCGSSAKNARESVSSAEAPSMPAYDSYSSSGDYDYYAEEQGESFSAAKAEAAGGLSAQNGASAPRDMAEKIIYNASATLETTEFDKALELITEMVREMGGFMESTSVSGSDYSSISKGSSGARRAYYVIRVPSARFQEFTDTLSNIGNVPNCETRSQNITMQYYDVQSRLEAYRVQETRLLEMLAIAETVEDMLTIQEHLTEVQYQIDSLTGSLRYMDNQVGYSTVDLSVREVREYTPEPTVQLTYWQRMSRDFRSSLKSTGRFFTELFLWLVTSLPWLVPLGGAVALLIWLLRRRVRRNPALAQRRAERKAQKARRRSERKARRKGRRGIDVPDTAPVPAPAPGADAEQNDPSREEDA